MDGAARRETKHGANKMNEYTEGENVTLKSILSCIAKTGTIERKVSAGYMVRVRDLQLDKWMLLFFDASQIEKI